MAPEFGRAATSRVFSYLLAWLAEPDVGNLPVEAAGALGDPRLLPLLQRLKAKGWQDDEPRPKVLDDAITRCSQGIGGDFTNDGGSGPATDHAYAAASGSGGKTDRERSGR